LQGVGLAAVQGEIAIVARGEAEARTFHVKRVVRELDGRWVLRSDDSAVPPSPVGDGDAPVGVVLRVVRPEELAREVGSE
jgi:hypothetical protein